MPYSIQSTLQELLSNEQAKAVIEKHMPGASTHPDLPMAMHMTLQQISTTRRRCRRASRRISCRQSTPSLSSLARA